jgi:hypothetical protein
MKDNILDGLNNLKKYKNELQSIIFDEEILKDQCNNLLENLNNIINIRQMESFRDAKIFNSSQLIETNKLVIENWNGVRRILAKYIYSSNYNEKSFFSLNERLDKIYDQEYKYNELVFKLI